MNIEPLFHSATFTWSHLLYSDGDAAIIDPVLDYDARSGTTATEFADLLLNRLSATECQLRYIWETHAHADHLSASAYLKQKTGAKLGVGAGIKQVQAYFQQALNITGLHDAFDEFYRDGDSLSLGGATIQVIGANGHTPDSLIFLVGDKAFIGDTLFAPDVGSARCDFPGASADDLWNTAQRILALPAQTTLYFGHDYPTTVNGVTRDPMACVSVADQLANNIHVKQGTEKASFITMRRQRDSGLAAPNLLWPALNCNIRGGLLPEAEDNGVSYLKIPLNKFKR